MLLAEYLILLSNNQISRDNFLCHSRRSAHVQEIKYTRQWKKVDVRICFRKYHFRYKCFLFTLLLNLANIWCHFTKITKRWTRSGRNKHEFYGIMWSVHQVSIDFNHLLTGVCFQYFWWTLYLTRSTLSKFNMITENKNVCRRTSTWVVIIWIFIWVVICSNTLFHGKKKLVWWCV